MNGSVISSQNVYLRYALLKVVFMRLRFYEMKSLISTMNILVHVQQYVIGRILSSFL